MSFASWLGFAPSSNQPSGQQRRAAEIRKNARAGDAAMNRRPQDRSITAWFSGRPPTRSS